jgi:hypothetical protein
MNPLSRLSQLPVLAQTVGLLALVEPVHNLRLVGAPEKPGEQAGADRRAVCMDRPLKLDYLWAALCIMGAVYFIFRS